MKIGGYQKVSLIDYPGKVAAVIFTSGCNFRCPYCHNRDLVISDPPSSLQLFDSNEILEDLKERQNLLDGVVLTGGEPTLQKDLFDFVGKIKKFGFLVKLDTNGSLPTIIQFMVSGGLVDYVALDVKAPLDERYETVSKYQSVNVSRIRRSIILLSESKVGYELRTTVVPGLHSEQDLLDLARQLSKIAPKAKWVLQNFRPKNCLDPEFEKIKPYDKMFLENVVERLQTYMPNVSLR